MDGVGRGWSEPGSGVEWDEWKELGSRVECRNKGQGWGERRGNAVSMGSVRKGRCGTKVCREVRRCTTALWYTN